MNSSVCRGDGQACGIVSIDTGLDHRNHEQQRQALAAEADSPGSGSVARGGVHVAVATSGTNRDKGKQAGSKSIVHVNEGGGGGISTDLRVPSNDSQKPKALTKPANSLVGELRSRYISDSPEFHGALLDPKATGKAPRVTQDMIDELVRDPLVTNASSVQRVPVRSQTGYCLCLEPSMQGVRGCFVVSRRSLHQDSMIGHHG